MSTGLMIGLIFLGVFAVIALPLIALSGSSKKSQEIQSRLDSALATETPEVQNLVVDLRKDEQLSSIPWLNRKLTHLELTPYLRKILDQANLNWSTGRLLSMMGAAFVIPSVIIHFKFTSIPLTLLVGAVLGAAPLGFVYFKRSKRFGSFEQGLPEALDLMVSGLRAGHSLIAAMGLVGRECPDPVGGEFKICFEEQNYGLELKNALDNLTDRVPLQDLRIVATAITIQKESGGNLAEVLDKTAYVIRERFRLKRNVQTHTAQGRLTGWILTLLPVALGVAIYSINPKMMSVLWTRDIGIKLLWASAGMTVIGGMIIRKIVNMEV
jgi:tight adherence protein B